jgi:hypothetical protein
MLSQISRTEAVIMNTANISFPVRASVSASFARSQRETTEGLEHRMPRNPQYPNRAIGSQNPSNHPMKAVLQDYTTCIRGPTSPLHLNINSHPEGVDVMNIEKRQDDDNTSLFSEMEMASIKEDPNYNPALDPMLVPFVPFVPPMEITIRMNEPIPQWLQHNASSIPPRSVSRTAGAELIRQTSCRSQTEYRDISIDKVQAASIYGSEGRSSYYTCPTVDLLSDGSTQTMMLRQGRKGLVRREITHMLGKVRLFKRKDSTRPGRPFRIQSTSGCLA